MAGSAASIRIRVASDLKAQADRLFGTRHESHNSIQHFCPPSLCEGRIPFEISPNQPGSETAAAMPEAEGIAKGPAVKGCTNPDELFADLKA